MTFTEKVNNKWLLGILVAAVAIIAVMPMLGQEAEAGTNVPYYDESGVLQYAPSTIDLDPVVTPNPNLVAGAGNYYCVPSSGTFSTVTITGSGDLILIIPNGVTMAVTNTIVVIAGVNLKLYTDTLTPADRGVLSSSHVNYSFELITGATLTNTVNVRYSGSGASHIVVYGASGGSVYNYGEIASSPGANAWGIRYLSGDVINYPGGLIKGGNGVYIGNFVWGTLTNDGTIQGGAGVGFQVMLGSNILLTNNGSISGTSHGVHFSGAAPGATAKLINNGTITGSSATNNTAGVYVNNSATIVNNLGATIKGVNGIYIGNFNNGISAASYDVIENYGLIEGPSSGGSDTILMGRGIHFVRGSNIQVTNYSTGEISGQIRGIMFASTVTATSGKIDNHGTINGGTQTNASIPSYGIDARVSVTIINYSGATIKGVTGVYYQTFNGAVNTFTNSGVIEAVSATNASTTTGNYLGRGIVFVGLSTGTNTLFTNNSTGEVKSPFMGILLNSSSTATGSITNNGKITATMNVAISVMYSATITNTGDGTATGIIQSSGTSAISIGTISGPGALGDTITNSGRIQGTSYGINVSGGRNLQIVNTGTIIATTNTGIYAAAALTNTGKIENYGSISGHSFGISVMSITVVNDGDGLTNGLITGTGTAAGTGTGLQLRSFIGTDSVTNDGKIEGKGGPGIDFVAGTNGTVTNNSTGIITGATHGINLTSPGTLTVTIDNHNVISGGSTGTNCGIFAGVSVSVTNRAGAEITGAYGIQIGNFNGAADSVTNSGLISGTARGVYFVGGTGILLTNNNEITGGTVGVRMDVSGEVVNDGSIEGTADTGIHLAAGGKVTNNSTITGATYGMNASAGANPVTLINKDVIDGNVVLNAGVNEITFYVDSRINGNFNISSSAAGSKLSFIEDPANLLGAGHIYSTVTGTTNIGTATVNVEFSTLPLPFDGWDIVLIDGTGGSVTGTSANSTYPLGGHTFFIRAKLGHQLVASLSEDDILVTMNSFPVSPALHYIRESPLGFMLPLVTYTGPFYAGSSEHLYLIVDNAAGYRFVEWVDDIGNVVSAIQVTSPPVPLLLYLGTLTVTFTAEFKAGPIGPYQYYITAIADSGSTITPAGVIVLDRGQNQTFVFEAKTGYVIVEVWIDGVRDLTPSEIDLGEFTFWDIMANHSITVKSIPGSKTDPILRIDIMEGEGYAEYRVDNGDFIRYRGEVILPMGSNLTVRAVPASGFMFDRWESPAVHKTNETHFDNVRGPLYLELYFAVDDTGKVNSLIWWILLLIILLIIAAFLLWFFLYYRKTYDVIKIESSISIIGSDKVRRKSEYSFKVEGTPSGTISYRVGEAGQWKQPFLNPSGEYVIPKGEITDTVTIEDR